MAKQQAQPAVERKAPRISRHAAANQVVAEMGARSTLSELAKAADSLCVEGGMKSRPSAAVYCVKRALETLEAMGLCKLTRPTDLLVERVKAGK